MTTQVGADYGVRLIVDTKVNTISAYSFDGFNNKDGIYLGSTFGDIADGCNGCNGVETPWIYNKEFAIVTADLTAINDNASKLGVFKFDMGERTYVEMGRVGGTIQYQNPNCVPGSRPRPDCGQITNYAQLDIPFASGERFVDYNTSVVGGEAVSEPLPLAVMISSMVSLMVWRKKRTKKHSV